MKSLAHSRSIQRASTALLIALSGLSGGCARYVDWVFCSRCADGAAAEAGVDGAGHDAAQPQGIRIAAVAFSMGSPESELCREPWSSLETEHQVTLTRAFYMAATEVTQADFSARMGYAPSSRDCSECPVENLSWHEAAAYCNALSDEAQLARCYDCQGSGAATTCQIVDSGGDVTRCEGFRLPTEAEWEVAARAGTTSATPLGELTACDQDSVLDPQGWYQANSNAVQPVGQKRANAWGLYDMLGNVWEWCNDWHEDELGAASVSDPLGAPSGTHRVVRGGSYDDDAGKLRSAMRDSTRPDERFPYLGFRCARSEL